MKKLRGRDALGLAAALILVGFLSIDFGKGKGKQVPLDDRHRATYEAIKSGRDRTATELLCATCHGKSSIPLPKDHPPKEECLICHLLAEVDKR